MLLVSWQQWECTNIYLLNTLVEISVFYNIPFCPSWEKDITANYFNRNAGTGNAEEWICTADFKSGSWIGLSKVDLAEGPVGFTAKVKGQGILAVLSDAPSSAGTMIAIAEVDSPSEYTEIRVPLVNRLKGVQDELYITSTGNMSLESWSFVK